VATTIRHNSANRRNKEKIMEERTLLRDGGSAAALGFLLLTAAAAPVDARITSLTIVTKTSPAFPEQSLGNVLQYEQLDGTASGEIDPKDPRNAVIQDIDLAPRNARGMIEYSMDISILKPIDVARGNHTILYDVVNRGRKNSPAFNIGGSATALGDGFLESEGYTLAWSGWEGDIASGIKIKLPVAKNKDGSEITGRVRAEYILNSAASTVDVTAPPAYEAVSTGNTGATLTRRVHQDDPKEAIDNGQWAFADCSTKAFPGVPSTTKVCLEGGFDTNHIYELVYTAKNPTVTGIGFAATRDFIEFLRGEGDKRRGGRDHGHGSDANAAPALVSPLGNSIDQAIIYGSSQSGRWIRTFLQLGFNEGADHNRVFEGAIPHKASNRGAFNVRFAQPTRLSGTQHTEKQFPGQESPQSWGDTDDPIAHIFAGQLDRCRKSDTCPKITATETDTEYWQALMALNTTDAHGRRDFDIPSNVRIYHLAGTQHGGGDPLALPTVVPDAPTNCQLPANGNPFIPAQRALLVALQQWITHGKEPPPSLYPTLRRHSLVPVDQIRIPYIPAVHFTVPGLYAIRYHLDRGPEFDERDASGVMNEPPRVGAAYAALAPQVDADGNDIDGLRNTNLQVPLGTYTGWNIRRAGFSEGDSCDLTGGFIPFFKTKVERDAAGDPRRSLAERYPTHADYVAKVTEAANRLAQQRLLLRQDADLIISQAQTAAVP
jgi:Alpha/beta hydrolase domain